MPRLEDTPRRSQPDHARWSELVPPPNYEKIKSTFHLELVLASEGKPLSLSYLRHPLPERPLITEGKMQAIVIGGTNYEFSTVKIARNNQRFIHRKKPKGGPFDTVNALFGFIQARLEPDMDAIGINIAFPLEPAMGAHGELDGKLIQGTKKHALAGANGIEVGQRVNAMYQVKFHKDIPVTVANDTICLALAGNGDEDGGVIIGTGFNMSLREQQGMEKVYVNLESGNFDYFRADTILEKIDKASENPGNNRFEKMLSGPYLPLHFNLIASQRKLLVPRTTSSKRLTDWAINSETDAGTLAQALFERSASLVASQIAGLYEFRGRPETMTLIGEGSLFREGWCYEENIQHRLDLLNVPKGAIHFKEIQDSTIQGTIGLLTK